MKEKPILMSTANIPPTLDGRKTQTRRIVNRLKKFGKITEFGKLSIPGYDWTFRNKKSLWNDISNERLMLSCPYEIGMHLWVRETFIDLSIVPGHDYEKEPYGYKANGDWDQWVEWNARWTSPRYMPRIASRIIIKVLNIRVERIQDITIHDAIAEGIKKSEIDDFKDLWDSINAKRGHGWDKNDWVFVYDFERVK